MAPHFEIRPYHPDQRAALIRIGQAVIDEGTTFPFLEIEGVLRYWLNEQTKVFIAATGEHVVGSYALKPNLPGRGDHICNAGYMVDVDCRRQGIGRALAEHSLTVARQLGYLGMQFNHVVSTNPAVQLWRSLGFQTVGEVPASFRLPDGTRVSTLVMYRELSD